MSSIELTIDLSEFREIAHLITNDQILASAKTSIQRATTAGRESMVLNIRKKWNLKTPRLRDKIELRAFPRVDVNGVVTGSIHAEWRRGISIADFGGKEVFDKNRVRSTTRQSLMTRTVAERNGANRRSIKLTRAKRGSAIGVTAEIIKGRVTKYASNTFMARASSGFIAIFRRMPRGGSIRMRRTGARGGAFIGASKWKIVPLHMVSFGTIINNNNKQPILQLAGDRVLDSWNKEFNKNLRHFTGTRRRRP